MGFTDVFHYSLTLSVVVIIVAFIILWNVAVWLLQLAHQKKFRKSLLGRHVIVTGGSQGLGRELATEYAKLGAKVTILARNKQRLATAKKEIIAAAKKSSEKTPLTTVSPVVHTVSADVTDFAALKAAIAGAENELGPVYLLVCCAGKALTGYFLENTPDTFKWAMELNYLGTVHAVKSVVDSMASRKEGHILLVSSALALCGRVGYSTYTPTKFAIRGLGDTLRNELLPYNIRFYQAYPPGMKTPGFDEENKTKPKECVDIEADEEVFQPEDVARSIEDSVSKGHYHIGCGDFGIHLLTHSAIGMSYRNNTLASTLWAPLLTIVSTIFVSMWDKAVISSKYDSVRPKPAASAGSELEKKERTKSE